MNVGTVLSGLLIGVIGGLMSGALGVSSGGALVPLAFLFLNVDQHVAQGISPVAQIFPSSLAGLHHYVSRGRGFPVQWLWFVAAGFICGGILGALCATQITSVALRWGFVGYLVVLETALIIRHRSARDRTSSTARGSAVIVTKLFACRRCLVRASGDRWRSGDDGSGERWTEVPQHQSQALSLAATALPLTLPAAWTYLRRGANVPSVAILGIVVGLCVGTDLGSRIANRLSARTLNRTLMPLVAGMALFKACKAAGSTRQHEVVGYQTLDR